MVRAGTALARLRARLTLDDEVGLIEASDLFDFAHVRAQVRHQPSGMRDAIRGYLRAPTKTKPAPSRLFDPRWYVRQNADVAVSGLDPLVHYIRHGAAEGRAPHPLFDAKYYAETIGARTDRSHLLQHFFRADSNRWRSPHPLFDSSFYAAGAPEALAHPDGPFFHYLDKGAAELRAPHRLFDPRTYLANAKLALPPGGNPLTAYLSGPNTAPTHYLFDPGFYLETYADVAAADVNPLVHYVTCGSKEGRSPSPFFDQTWYLQHHATDTHPGKTVLESYLAEGVAAGHDPNEYFDGAFYAATCPEVARDGALTPIHHFLEHGLARGLAPSPRFDPAFYATRNPEIHASGGLAYEHFMRRGRYQNRYPYSPAQSLREGRFAVILHLYYLDLLPEFERLLAPLADLLDLFVTVPADDEPRFRARVATALPSATIVAVENAGRDIGAFFDAIRQIDLTRYVAVCKIHGKKGRTERDVWRFMMLHTLLGSREIVEEITASFRFDRDVWFVGPAAFYISARRFIGPNMRSVVRLLSDLYPHLWPDFDWGFFAGTMFWFRPVAIERLAGAIQPSRAFANDRRASDGEMAHAIERVFALACAIEKKKVGRVLLEGDDFERPVLVVGPARDGISQDEPAETLSRFATMLGDKVCRSSPPPRMPRRTAGMLSPQAGVNFIGPLGVISGLGTSARAYLELLENAGVAVNCVDWVPGFNRLKRLPVVLPRMDAPAPVNIVHINLDLMIEGGFLVSGALADLMEKAQRNILVFYWELPTLKPEWLGLLARFDEVWCPTRFIETTVQSASDVPTRLLRPELRTLDRPMAVADRARLNLPPHRFVFAYVMDGGSVLRRKNPRALVEAFRAEFREDEMACCYLKIHYAGAADLAEIAASMEAREDMIFCDDLYDDATMDVLFQSIDCYVSPHRSEGLGLTIIDAMKRGKPVIATPFGGAADFVTGSTAFPLDLTPIEVGPGADPYPAHFVWADPTIESLRRQMRHVFSHASDVATKTAAAGRHIAETCAANADAARTLFRNGSTSNLADPASGGGRRQQAGAEHPETRFERVGRE